MREKSREAALGGRSRNMDASPTFPEIPPVSPPKAGDTPETFDGTTVALFSLCGINGGPLHFFGMDSEKIVDNAHCRDYTIIVKSEKVRGSRFGDAIYTHSQSQSTAKILRLAGIEDPNAVITRINSGGLNGYLAETIAGDFWHSGRRRTGGILGELFTLRPLL